MPSDRKVHLLIFKTFIDLEKSQLMEISRRHDEMNFDLPDALTGDSFAQLEEYREKLRSALNACDYTRKAIAARLKEIE